MTCKALLLLPKSFKLEGGGCEGSEVGSGSRDAPCLFERECSGLSSWNGVVGRMGMLGGLRLATKRRVEEDTLLPYLKGDLVGSC